MDETTPELGRTDVSAEAPAGTGAAYAQALSQLGELLLDVPSLERLLDQLLDIALTAAPGVDAASVTAVDDDGNYTTVATTDLDAFAVDQTEYELDEGPCVATVQTGEEQLVVDVTTDSRWPGFNARAAELGFHSVAGLPLRVGERTLGALDLFARPAGGLDEATLGSLRRLSRPLSAALANARAYRRSERLSRELQGQLDRLADVNQAVGVLMAERGCDAATARALLHRTAETTGRSVDEVVTQLLRSVQG